ncbi:DUF2804 domain-containing protein [Myxococcus llanfairpwllgwyngyllgogerychwyrndrobwllllantysiliogogogochensis]|uniref:DUF2804 domain-containing protein n=1 Tax=Myxococcus llanfairpwllgwyngyllgogerychwyrndrobwllllantysiliogogogochensis TaxID=2590453 RepID=A0A540X4I2_9BACT|nr:DUF2804 domain-containing protein [Myxococcus llanfairpwllgwyngyllgogerychwyrndrobwllllantysiliogogogochensis]TQF16157.1 DUF2804 domain-containing protein [Myxococcus llanfairpwllgwyngyllgogerychwyrndrobwllllantysiliogogogochensis]
MTPEREALLPLAPASVATSQGEPRFGTYQGELPEVDLPKLLGRWAPARATRLLKRKRWHYTFVATPEVAALFAVVDLGYSSSAFAVALDLAARKPLCDVSFLGAPGPMLSLGDKPGAGLSASFRTLGGKLAIRRGETDERYQVEVDVSRVRTGSLNTFQWAGELLVAGGPPALTVIAPVQGDGLVNVTMKRNGLLSFGSLEAGGKRFRLDGGVGGIDYTQGYLARHTAWRWAFAAGRLADGTPVGLNLVEGFNESNTEANENALWLGDRLYPLARARFEYDTKDLLAPWRLTTVDGAVDLRFQPFYVHREERNLRLIISHFAQPVGFFEGTVTVGGQTLQLSNVPGVTEDQDMLW